MTHIPTHEEFQATLALTVKAMKAAARRKAAKERQERESRPLYKETIVKLGTTSSATTISWMDTVNGLQAQQAILSTCSENEWFATWVEIKWAKYLIESAESRKITMVREIRMVRI
jgi:hypothetical protein